MWQQPKTDWQAGDYFNIEDYNRIKGNSNELHSLAQTIWPEFDLEDMGADKTYQDYSFYADEINRFEENLELLCEGTYPFQIGEKKLYADNTPFIKWDELNRIESACLLLYLNMRAGIESRPTLEFTLGGDVSAWL